MIYIFCNKTFLDGGIQRKFHAVAESHGEIVEVKSLLAYYHQMYCWFSLFLINNPIKNEVTKSTYFIKILSTLHFLTYILTFPLFLSCFNFLTFPCFSSVFFKFEDFFKEIHGNPCVTYKYLLRSKQFLFFVPIIF